MVFAVDKEKKKDKLVKARVNKEMIKKRKRERKCILEQIAVNEFLNRIVNENSWNKFGCLFGAPLSQNLVDCIKSHDESDKCKERRRKKER
jgi:hypothetical protein